MRSSVDVWTFLVFGCVICCVVCPPVTEEPTEEVEEDPESKMKEDVEMKFGLEYEHYLKEVLDALESDENFRKKLEESNITEIKIDQLLYEKYLREVMTLLMSDSGFAQKVIDAGQNFSQQSGEIARNLDFVAHGIRSKLDELKRKELDRLRQILKLQSQLQSNGGVNMDIFVRMFDKDRLLAHLDHSNPNSFEISDLTKLIHQTTRDLELVDRKRREEFKKYEMEKEVERLEQLSKLDENERAEKEKKFMEMEKKHRNHPKLHHPGNEEQLKEVWEESDGLNKQEFDPKTFFYLHDTNGDGVLDQAEIEALFQKELDKVYDPTAPEDDMNERYEEMNRMREHMMNEIDENKDKTISLEEFVKSTKDEDFKRDEEWETIDKEKIYNNEELEEFRKQYEEMKQRQQQRQLENEKIPKDRVNFDGGRDQPVQVMHQQQQQQRQQHDINPRGQHQQQQAVNDLKPPQGQHMQTQGHTLSSEGHLQAKENKQQLMLYKHQAQGHEGSLQGHKKDIGQQRQQL